MAPAWAATFTTDFTTLPAQAATFGSAATQNGVLQLAIGAGQVGSLVIDDLEGGGAVAGFTAEFKLKAPAAPAGFAFSFAPDVEDAPFGETGSGAGFTISFITGQGSATAQIRRGGALLWEGAATLPTAQFVPVKIDVRTDGALTLTVNNQELLKDLFAYVPIPGRFGFGARSGDSGGEFAIDDLRISTIPQTGPFVIAASPTGPGASPASVITIELQDFSAEVDPASIRLSLNSGVHVPTVSKEGSITSISFDPPGNLSAGSDNVVVLTYTAGGQTYTAQYAFRVTVVATLTSAMAHATVDTNAPGFRLRVVQAAAAPILTNTLLRAEAQLAGTLTNEATGQPYVNEANLSAAGPNGFIQETGVINYASGGTAGFFANDEGIPGIPGNTGHANNFATEVITWLYLPAGGYRMGVNSDDGFQLRAGLNARDATSDVLGFFEGTRAGGETRMDFIVEQAGYYSFRLLWFQGEGSAHLEWYSIDLTTGERVLINDPANPKAIRAYRSGPSTPYLAFASPMPRSIVETNATISLLLAPGDSPIWAETVQLRLNNQLVNATVKPAANNQTSVEFTPTTPFPAGSVQTVRLNYSDTQHLDYSHQFTFSVRATETPRLSIALSPTGQVTVTWPGGGTLEETTDLKQTATTWTPVAGNPSGTYTTTATGTKRFFRLRF